MRAVVHVSALAFNIDNLRLTVSDTQRLCAHVQPSPNFHDADNGLFWTVAVLAPSLWNYLPFNP